MRIPVIRHGRIAALACGIGLAGAFFAAMPGRTFALTKESPEVVAAVERGIKFLDSDAAHDDRPGAKALVGLCLVEHPLDPTNRSPRIAAAATKIRAALGNRDIAKLDPNVWDIYSVGLSIIFLVEYDREKYRPDIECLLAYLHKRQKPHGGWGYEGRETGDTSMTQYGVLSSWTAKRAGFNVPNESIEAAANWLMRTQDPSGAFGYQGNLAPSQNALVPQSDIRPSMTAAASGSLYICADFLDLIEKKEKRENLPAALREVKRKEVKEKAKTKIDVRSIRETETLAKKWQETNNKIEGSQWTHYYLYALERCMSFRESFDQHKEAEPRWYTEGAEFLLKSQTTHGSWSGQCGEVPDTAFGILFLIRSTQGAIIVTKKYGGGVMEGHRGIPSDTIDGPGPVVAKPLPESGAALIGELGNPDGRDFEKNVELLGRLPGDELEKLAAKYGNQIRDLARNKSPKARLAAVELLGKTRDLNNVETLIYALTDPDPSVVHAAEKGLVRIRRAPLTAALPENFSEDDRRLVVEKWKAWYQSIRPGEEMR